MILALASLAIALAPPGADCRAMDHRGQEDAARACFQKLTFSHDPGMRAEGLWGLEKWLEAGHEFEQALKAQPKSAFLRVRYGRLLLQRFNQGDAAKLFQEALGIDRDNTGALLGLALIASENFSIKALEYSRLALEKAPENVEVLELLARLYVEESDPARAITTADKALGLSADALDAMAVHAAVELLADRDASTWLDRIARRNPRYGEAHVLIARLFVLNRRYDEAIHHYREALRLKPTLLVARTELGVQLMRVGKDTEAREQLQAAYDAGFRNAATTNSLRLLDSDKRFITYKSDRLILKLQRKEAELLRPYAEREAQRALDAYEKKYRMKLPGPVSIEMYPDHEDFAVRSLGLPGLGALGVTFNMSVVMDSPSGRPPGSFHWSSTMWHELSHVFVIEATHQHVPRWFTEGVAVHEESAANPQWGDRLTPPIVASLTGKKLLGVNELDRGFIRPSYHSQVLVSYFQAGRMIDYIVSRWGWDAVLNMISGFGRHKTTAEVVQEVLGETSEAFDRDFLAWIDKQHAAPMRNYAEWKKRKEEFDHSPDEKALAEGQAVIELYPDEVGEGCVYLRLERIYEKRNDDAARMRNLQQYIDHGGLQPEMFKSLAGMYERDGKLKEAADVLEQVNGIFPVGDEELHRKLASLYASLGRWPAAVDECRAVVASKPADPAKAHYQLALALKEIGKIEDARDAVTAALEVAPGYRPAQRLLLELTAQSAGKEKDQE